MLTRQEKYKQNPHFKHLVVVFRKQLKDELFTIFDLLDAVMLAVEWYDNDRNKETERMPMK